MSKRDHFMPHQMVARHVKAGDTDFNPTPSFTMPVSPLVENLSRIGRHCNDLSRRHGYAKVTCEVTYLGLRFNFEKKIGGMIKKGDYLVSWVEIETTDGAFLSQMIDVLMEKFTRHDFARFDPK